MAWHDQKTIEQERWKSGLYVPSPKTQIDPLLGKTKKFYAAQFYQLKIGHGAIATFLKRIGAIETSECWWCADAEQSVINLYTKYRKWRAKRQIYKRNLGKAGIQWQGRPAKRWLVELLADKYAIGPLLELLKNTEVGSGEGGAEKEMEWRQRRDQEWEDQLGDFWTLPIVWN